MLGDPVIDTHSFNQRLSFTLRRESAIDNRTQFRPADEDGAKPCRLGYHRRLRKCESDRCLWNASELIGDVSSAHMRRTRSTVVVLDGGTNDIMFYPLPG